MPERGFPPGRSSRACFPESPLRARQARLIPCAGRPVRDKRRRQADSVQLQKWFSGSRVFAAGCSPHRGRRIEDARVLSYIARKQMVFCRGTVEDLPEPDLVVHDDYVAVSAVLLELIRADALVRGWRIIACPYRMHREDQIDQIFIPAERWLS